MGLQNKSVSSFLSTILTLTFKKFTEEFDFSCANFKVGRKLLRRFRNPSSLSSSSVQMKNMSSIYLNHDHGLTIFELRKLFSILSKNKHAKDRSNLVPMAVPEVCWIILVQIQRNCFSIQIQPFQLIQQMNFFICPFF